MKILVTGGAGFIGSHVVRLLRGRSEVVVLDNFSGEVARSKKPESLVSPGVEVHHGDVRDLELVSSIIESGVDTVVHLAARTGVRESLTNAVEYESTNVGGTSTLLEALRGHPQTRLVFASSSSVYGIRRTGPFQENDAADRPASPYAATKRAGELLCYAAHHNWGLSVTCLRFFTVYGPGQRPGMAIATFVRQMLDDESITVYGDGASIRDYTWIDDAVRGIDLAIAKKTGFDIVNIGSGRPISLRDLIDLIGKVVGRDVESVALPEQEGDVPLTFADLSHAADSLGWRPTISLEEGLRRYVDFEIVSRDAQQATRSGGPSPAGQRSALFN